MKDIYKKRTIKDTFYLFLGQIFFIFLLNKNSRFYVLYLINFSPKILKKYLFHRYNLKEAPISFTKSKNLSSLEFETLKTLCLDGIVKLPLSFRDDVLRTNYHWKNLNKSAHGSLELGDSLIKIIRENILLKNVTSCYYSGNLFIRENPTFHINTYQDYINNRPPSDVYHADGFRQLSVMLFLDDVSEQDIFMKYALGSHVNMQPTYDRSLIEQELVESKYQIFNVIGKVGDIFLFDTEGLHKGYYNKYGKRAMIHWNFHSGIYKNKVSL
jgi:hypothetical protein